jgi:hypothetical protein
VLRECEGIKVHLLCKRKHSGKWLRNAKVGDKVVGVRLNHACVARSYADVPNEAARSRVDKGHALVPEERCEAQHESLGKCRRNDDRERGQEVRVALKKCLAVLRDVLALHVLVQLLEQLRRHLGAVLGGNVK